MTDRKDGGVALVNATHDTDIHNTVCLIRIELGGSVLKARMASGSGPLPTRRGDGLRAQFVLTLVPALQNKLRLPIMLTSKISPADSLDGVYSSLHKLLSRYAPPFKLTSGQIKDKKDLHLTVPKAVAVPGAYGGKPTEIAMASIILQKGYVGFYFMPIYVNPEVRSRIPAPLLKLLKGKSCFYIHKLDADLEKNIETALDEGVKCFKARGWV
jgi:hypothetical protein